jgi:short subunit fatty acids transporter
MVKSRRWVRWIMGLSGAAVLLQAGTCAVSNTQAQQQVVNELVLPEAASLFSDAIFFVLDNALVHLAT